MDMSYGRNRLINEHYYGSFLKNRSPPINK